MKLITRQVKAAEAAERWAAQYGVWKGNPLQRVLEGNAELVYQRLLALGPRPDPDQVDAVIGNTSWTEAGRCSECKATSPVLVRMGDEPDYESATAWLCPKCLSKALALVNAVCSEGAGT